MYCARFVVLSVLLSCSSLSAAGLAFNENFSVLTRNYTTRQHAQELWSRDHNCLPEWSQQYKPAELCHTTTRSPLDTGVELPCGFVFVRRHDFVKLDIARPQLIAALAIEAQQAANFALFLGRGHEHLSLGNDGASIAFRWQVHAPTNILLFVPGGRKAAFRRCSVAKRTSKSRPVFRPDKTASTHQRNQNENWFNFHFDTPDSGFGHL